MMIVSVPMLPLMMMMMMPMMMVMMMMTMLMKQFVGFRRHAGQLATAAGLQRSSCKRS